MFRRVGLYKGHSSIVRALWLTNSITVVTPSPATSSTEITLGILPNLTTLWKGYQKSKAGKSFRSIYISALAVLQEHLGACLLEKEKIKSKMGRKKISVLYNTHTLILLCCLQYICLLISSMFAKQGKSTSGKLDHITTWIWFQVPALTGKKLQILVLGNKRHTQSLVNQRHLQSTGLQQDRRSS